MNRETANIVATILGALGVIFILAMAFGVLMSRNIALFIGVACFVLAGTVRTLGRKS